MYLRTYGRILKGYTVEGPGLSRGQLATRYLPPPLPLRIIIKRKLSITRERASDWPIRGVV